MSNDRIEIDIFKVLEQLNIDKKRVEFSQDPVAAVLQLTITQPTNQE